MNEGNHRYELRSASPQDAAPVLIEVQAQGRVDAALFELEVRQRYRNTHSRPLEVTYTFPVPHGAVLLGFATELNSVRKTGLVVSKAKAEQQYEEAMDQGDLPVMLESLQGGSLFTASIGNLKPGEEIVLEVRYAQLLHFEQGRLRLSIPTVIAPRYGNALTSGLQPQQVPAASLQTEYPLTVDMVVGPALAGATLECPTHRLTTQKQRDGSVRLTLAPGAVLDRDVVLIVTPDEARPHVLALATDSVDPTAPVVMMAMFQPPAIEASLAVNLKLLVDCSGSMQGDSIASARAALRGVVSNLTDRDSLSLSRFGSSVDHVLSSMRAKPQTLRFMLPAIEQMRADLGGTEMAKALEAVCAIPVESESGGADILLITDGEIWDVSHITAMALQCKHRIFAIGVGHSPAEFVLRRLAQSTGGACEFATPGEALEAAAQRMLMRMRQRRYSQVRVDWGQTPVWSTERHIPLFAGDSFSVMAGFERAPEAQRVRLLACDDQGETVELGRCEAQAPCPGDALPRLAAWYRLEGMAPKPALDLALRYQLMSDQTNCILVHERRDVDKPVDSAVPHRVSQMLAAGRGGMGTVFCDSASVAHPAAFSNLFGAVTMHVELGPASFVMHPGSSRSRREDLILPALGTCSQSELRQKLAEFLARGGSRDDVHTVSDGLQLPAPIEAVIRQMMGCGLSYAEAWQVLGHWLLSGHLSKPASSPTARWIAGLDSDKVNECLRICSLLLGDPWVDDDNNEPATQPASALTSESK